MREMFSQNERSIRYIFLFTWMLLCFSLFGKASVMQANAASVPTPEIKSCSYIDEKYYDVNTLRITVNCPKLLGNYSLEIYRSSSKTGTYSCYATIDGTSFGYYDCYNCSCSSDDSKTIVNVNHVSLNKKYYYKVRLVDADGNTGAYSNTVSYTLKLVPVTVTKCYGASSTSAKLKWSKMNDADGYQIYRKVSGGKWKRIKTIKKNSTVSYTDKKLKSGKTYSYKIRAYQTSGSKKLTGFYSTVYKAKTSSPTVSGDYKDGSTYRLSSSKSKRTAVRRVVQGFKDNYIKSGMSKCDKLLAAYNYLRNNCTYCYNSSASNIDNAYGALVKGRAQCGGYACAMMALCDSINIPCRFIRSNDNSRMRHRWNEVKIGGKWYILDAEEGFFLVGSKTYKGRGWDWNAKDYPTVSTKCYKKGFPNLDDYY